MNSKACPKALFHNSTSLESPEQRFAESRSGDSGKKELVAIDELISTKQECDIYTNFSPRRATRSQFAVRATDD